MAGVVTLWNASRSWGPGAGPDGLRLRLAVEGFAGPMAVLVAVVAASVVLYAATGSEPGRRRLVGWLVGFAAAMELLVLAGDLLTLLVAWELVGVCSWALIGHRYRDPANPRAATAAFLTTRAGDLGLYVAAAAAFAGAGSLDFRDLAGLETPHVHLVAGGLLLAACAKSAQGPFAPWLFAAMAGPVPASALLHSAAMVAAGAYALIRLGPELAGGAPWLGPATLWVGLVTVWAGGLVAVVQTDLKRALAASTSSQYGLVFAAVGVGSAAAAGAHLLTHAAFKSLLFLGAGVAIHATGSGDLARLGRRGLGRALPAAAACFAVGALALAAVPPLGAAWSKEHVVAAAFAGGGGPGPGGSVVGTTLLLSGFLTAFYAGRLQLLAFSPAGMSATDLPRPSRGELWGMGALVALSLALGLLWLVGDRLQRWTGGPLPEPDGWERVAGAAAVVAAAGACLWTWRRRRLVHMGLEGNGGRSSAARLQGWIAGWWGLPGLARAGVARPVLVLSRRLAALDDRLVDAGVRSAARAGRAASRLLAGVSEPGVEGLGPGVARTGRRLSRGAASGLEGLVDHAVGALARGAEGLASGSGRFDDSGVDGTVEGVARATGRAGVAARRLQTGQVHHYYAAVAAGTLVLVLLVLVAVLFAT